MISNDGDLNTNKNKGVAKLVKRELVELIMKE